MPIDDWTWAWSSEQGRTNRLRDALSDVTNQHHAATARLSSKLSKLEGALESRLSALSTAFDAYVELGDVREQLRLLPDWGDARRAVQDALTELSSGGRTPLIDTQLHDHWLAHAMNAVVALSNGEAPEAHERRAVAASGQARQFIVLCSIAIGIGERLDGRLADLFTDVESLDPLHWLLLRGAAAGGVTRRELELIGQRLAPRLADPDLWLRWWGARRDSVRSFDEVREVLEGSRARADEAEWSYADVEEELTGAAAFSARSGSAEEQELLARAATLRARVENPTGRTKPSAETRDVARSVQQIIDHPATPDWTRAAIIEWMHPAVVTLLQQWRALPAPAPQSRTRRVRLEVEGTYLADAKLAYTSDGVDGTSLRDAKRDFESVRLGGMAASQLLGGAVVLAVLGFGLVLLGGGWGVLGAIAAIAAAITVVLGLRRRRREAVFESERTRVVGEMSRETQQEVETLRAFEEEQERAHADAVAQVDEWLAELSREATPLPAEEEAEQAPGRPPGDARGPGFSW